MALRNILKWNLKLFCNSNAAAGLSVVNRSIAWIAWELATEDSESVALNPKYDVIDKIKWTQQGDACLFFVFCFSQYDFVFNFSFFDIRIRAVSAFWHSKSYFYLKIGAEYHSFDSKSDFAIYLILTFEIPFWHSKWGRISNFDIRTGAENRLFTFKILFWRSNWDRLSHFDAQNGARISILTFKILFWRSNCDMPQHALKR